MKRFQAGVGLLLLLLTSMAQADSIEWVGWSADESRHAYFLRKPYGESGYTSVYLIVRNSKGKELSRFVIRDAKRLLSLPTPPDETETQVTQSEQTWRVSLYRKGYGQGRRIPFKLGSRPKVLRMAGMIQEPPASAILEYNRLLLKFMIWRGNQGRCKLLVERGKGEPIPITIDQKQMEVHTTGLGTDHIESSLLHPTDAIGFYLSPRGRWMSSLWVGKATLPDGFSWPAFAFHFSTSRLPRR